MQDQGVRGKAETGEGRTRTPIPSVLTSQEPSFLFMLLCVSAFLCALADDLGGEQRAPTRCLEWDQVLWNPLLPLFSVLSVAQD